MASILLHPKSVAVGALKIKKNVFFLLCNTFYIFKESMFVKFLIKNLK